MTLSKRFGRGATVGLVAVGLITTAAPAVPTAALAADVLIIAACVAVMVEVAPPISESRGTNRRTNAEEN